METTDGCGLAKMFSRGPDNKLIHYALGLRRHNLQILVGLLTGHSMLKKQLTTVRVRITMRSGLVCGEEEETLVHVIS